MKKLLTPVIALATMMLGITACQNDELVDNPAGGNEVEVTFTAQLENAAATRAIGDGTTARYLTFGVFKAASGAMGDEVEALRQEVEVKADLTATVTTRLVKGQTYNFVFWAQSESVAHEKDADDRGVGTYYNISDMSNIQVVYSENAKTVEANNEDRDAFLAVRKDLKVNGPINETITLKRPFAQVNVGTKIGSILEAATAESNIAKSEMTVKNVATVLNTYTGEGIGNKVGITFALANIPETNKSDNKGDLKNVKGTDYEYLSMNYILVEDAAPGDGKQLVECVLKLTDENNNEINTFNIPNVPVQRNWRTNIIGDILSSNVTFNIVIDPTFDDEHNYYINEELYYAAENGGEVTLQEPLTIDGSKEAPALVIKAGRSVILNLNGQSIKSTVTGTENTDAIYVEEGATLTINGEGTIETADGGNGYPIFARGKVVINGGTYISHKDADGATNACIYAKGNGEVEVNGGTFSTETGVYVLNLHDGSRQTASITAKGGTFVNFDPANNASEGAGTNFVADGYKSVNKGDNYIVVANDVEVVATADELTEALSSGATKVNLVGTVDMEKADVNLTNGIAVSGGTIQNATMKMAEGNTATFEGVTFDAETTVYATGNGAVSFKDCVFEVEPKKIANNSRHAAIVGNHQYSTLDMKLDGCTFNYSNGGGDPYNAAIFMWSSVKNVEIKNCVFNNYGFVAVKLMNVAEGAKIVFDNNTFNMSSKTSTNYWYNSAIQIVPQHDNTVSVSLTNNEFNGDYQTGSDLQTEYGFTADNTNSIVCELAGMNYGFALTKLTFSQSNNTVNEVAATDANFAIKK